MSERYFEVSAFGFRHWVVWEHPGGHWRGQHWFLFMAKAHAVILAYRERRRVSRAERKVARLESAPTFVYPIWPDEP